MFFRKLLLCTYVLLFLNTALSAQFGDCGAVADSFCIQLGEPYSVSVKDNDVLSDPTVPVFLLFPSQCIKLDPYSGSITVIDSTGECCRDHKLLYYFNDAVGAICEAKLNITVKCPKPECFLVNLNDYVASPEPTGLGPGCAFACEFSDATYFVPYNPTSSYSWSVSGGTDMPGGNDAEKIITWGAVGTGSVTLTIMDTYGAVTVLNICVEILESPIAAFSTAASCVCKNGPISFTNLTTGASDFYWDFGDGNNSTAYEPTHTYSSGGTYTVTLYANRANFDINGSPLCCCTDTFSLVVTVDSLEGPNIYWVSTLCEEDSSKYWTDATGCGIYDWEVFDADGLAMSFIGDTDDNDTICVNWGDGPFGTVELTVSGCDSVLCDKPVSVLIPIIPDTANLVGPTEVCENATETYTLPKWISTYYNWTVSGGSIQSGQGTNTVSIKWGTAPGPGIIHVDYYSDFLSGLPGHEDPDCIGTADLIVEIKPAFDVFGPAPALACVNSTSFYFSTTACNWTVSPLTTISGDGTAILTVTWDNPGSYIITASPVDTTIFCNDLISLAMTVVELPPMDSITGEVEICPGETEVYFGHSSSSATQYNWTVTGGTPSSFSGDPISVTWNPTGPYILSVIQTQIGAPYCTSDPISITVNPKQINGPLVITGGDTCINTVNDYALTLLQHPDAEITWTISPGSAGAVVSGQGTENIEVQWNNDPGPVTLTVTVELCGVLDSVVLNLNLNGAIPPVITQVGILCPGASAVLDAGAGYSSYLWSDLSLTQTTIISSAGTYIVTVTGANGCEASDTYEAFEVEGPVANISTPDPQVLCIVPPNSNTVVIYAETNVNYTFVWYCNGDSQSLPPTQAVFTHTNTNVVGSFAYQVKVTDITTGCMTLSDFISVTQTDNCIVDTGETCEPRAHTVIINVSNNAPACNEVNFDVLITGPVIPGSWNFGDPVDNINTGSLINALHDYSKAGYYNANFVYQVAEALPGTGFCLLGQNVSVCIPVASDFEFTDSCGLYCFKDLSTYLPGNDITDWTWTFGDGGNSTDQNPKYTYSIPGTYLCTLTVETSTGCIVSVIQSITVVGPPLPGLVINPNPACVGDSISFMGSGTSILTWLWDFDDGANNAAQNPSHTYMTDGVYNVSLTVTNENGCEGSASFPLTIFPLPADDTISWLGSLTICEGEEATLIAPLGFTYLWSTGESTQIITTDIAGDYSVIITDANGCELELDPVEVIVIPKPDAAISGSLFICDDGCVTLSATVGAGFLYQWTNHLFSPLFGQTAATLEVCDFSLLPGYSVIITNANGCVDTAAVVIVSVVTAPSFSIDVIGDTCEATLNTFKVNPIQVNVVYSWSNGTIGPVTTAVLAGVYTVYGTDTLTGCTTSQSVTINPLPDLCIVPAGCYEACNPDTICGPDGLAFYQWNQNGIPITGANDPCLIVTTSGSYTLTGVTSSGCSATSDSLILVLIDCDTTVCDSVDVQAISISSAADSCCWDLSLSNAVANYFIGVRIDAIGGIDLNFTGSVAGWLPFESSSSHVSLLEPGVGFVDVGAYAGTLANVAQFCLSNYTTDMQQVIVSWMVSDPGPSGYAIECTDTLTFNCEPEGCVAVVEDTIYCIGDSVKYTFYIENQSWSESLESVNFNLAPSSGMILDPDPLNFPPILPGATAGPFTICISNAFIGDTLKFFLSAHDSILIPGIEPTFCCTDTFEYCVPIPNCRICDLTHVDAQLDTADCCYNITLTNSLDASYFTSIETEFLTPGAAFGAIGSGLPLGWVYNLDAPNVVTWSRLPLGSGVPLGSTALPTICVDGNYPDSIYLAINWMTGTGDSQQVACRDTVLFICDPSPDPCVNLINDSIYCDDQGKYFYQFQIANNSGYSVDELVFTGITPAGIVIDPILVSVADGDTSSLITTCITGVNAIAGQVICFNVTLHDLEAGYDFACCTSDTSICITLPECDTQGEPCVEDIILDDKASVKINTSVVINVLGNDLCPPGYTIDPSTVSIVTPPTFGLIGTIDPVSGAIAYSYVTSFSGFDCFTYEVCCVNDITGELSCCTAQVCVNLCNKIDKPDGLVSTVLSATVQLEWNVVSESEASQIEANLIPGGTTSNQNLNIFEASGRTVPFSVLGMGSSWRWRVRSACNLNPVEATPFSDWDTFTVPGFRIVEPLPIVKLFPNPVRNSLQMSFYNFEKEEVEIRITNPEGRTVYATRRKLDLDFENRTIDVTSLSSGVYNVHIIGDSEVKTLRFVKHE